MTEVIEIICDAERKILAATGRKVKVSISFDLEIPEGKFDSRPAIDILNDLCVREFRVESLQNKSRKMFYSQARNVFSYLVRKYLSLSYVDIGKFLGKDHSTIMYGINQCQIMIENNKPFAFKFYHIEECFTRTIRPIHNETTQH